MSCRKPSPVGASCGTPAVVPGSGIVRSVDCQADNRSEIPVPATRAFRQKWSLRSPIIEHRNRYCESRLGTNSRLCGRTESYRLPGFLSHERTRCLRKLQPPHSFRRPMPSSFSIPRPFPGCRSLLRLLSGGLPRLGDIDSQPSGTRWTTRLGLQSTVGLDGSMVSKLDWQHTVHCRPSSPVPATANLLGSRVLSVIPYQLCTAERVSHFIASATLAKRARESCLSSDIPARRSNISRRF